MRLDHRPGLRATAGGSAGGLGNLWATCTECGPASRGPRQGRSTPADVPSTSLGRKPRLASFKRGLASETDDHSEQTAGSFAPASMTASTSSSVMGSK